jgi:hypothetical protein
MHVVRHKTPETSHVSQKHAHDTGHRKSPASSELNSSLNFSAAAAPLLPSALPRAIPAKLNSDTSDSAAQPPLAALAGAVLVLQKSVSKLIARQNGLSVKRETYDEGAGHDAGCCSGPS